MVEWEEEEWEDDDEWNEEAGDWEEESWEDEPDEW